MSMKHELTIIKNLSIALCSFFLLPSTDILHLNETPRINTFARDFQSNLKVDTTILKTNARGEVIKRKIQTSDSTFIIQIIDSYFGYISDILPYTHNKLEGLSQTFSAEGNVIHEIPWHDGKIVGTENFYLEDGRLDWSRQYDSLGLLHGNLTIYYNTGSVKSYQPFEWGKQNGIGCSFDLFGNLKYKYYYVHDTLKKIEQFEDGNIVKFEELNKYDPYVE